MPKKQAQSKILVITASLARITYDLDMLNSIFYKTHSRIDLQQVCLIFSCYADGSLTYSPRYSDKMTAALSMQSIPREEHFVFTLNDWTRFWGYKPIHTYNHCNYRFGLHLHDFIEINIILKGRGKHFFDKRVFDVARGDVFVVPVHCQHGYGDTVGLDVFHMLLHPRFVTAHTAELLSLPGYLMVFTVEPYFRSEEGDFHHFSLDKPRLSNIMRLLKLLDNECRSATINNHVASESLAMFIIALLCRWRSQKLPDTGGKRTPEACKPVIGIQRCIEYIQRNYAASITTLELARVACMERSHFIRTFHRCLGLSPMEFVRNHRIRMAKDLLVRTDKSISQIAIETGFYDTAHFSRTFKEITGCTPRETRKP